MDRSRIVRGALRVTLGVVGLSFAIALAGIDPRR